jgi:hypothetical protein
MHGYKISKNRSKRILQRTSGRLKSLIYNNAILILLKHIEYQRHGSVYQKIIFRIGSLAEENAPEAISGEQAIEKPANPDQQPDTGESPCGDYNYSETDGSCCFVWSDIYNG